MITLDWVLENYEECLQVITLLVVAGEMVTRLTPTKLDDGFIHRIGRRLDQLLDILKVPNLRKKIESDDVDRPD